MVGCCRWMAFAVGGAFFLDGRGPVPGGEADGRAQRVEEMEHELSRVWSPVSHLQSVLGSREWRQAYNEALPILTEYGTELSQTAELQWQQEQLQQCLREREKQNALSIQSTQSHLVLACFMHVRAQLGSFPFACARATALRLKRSCSAGIQTDSPSLSPSHSGLGGWCLLIFHETGLKIVGNV